jgi:uncharacterized phage protein (TIGR01671 family)|nr:YopX family protein [uncultured Streptococcus sp.]
MIPKFRAYDGGSLNRMYQPDEVMVGNGDIWIIDEDSVAGEWIVNNDIHLMQSTGLKDKNGVEIFEGDILGIETDEGILNVNVFWDNKRALFMFESEIHNEKELLAEFVEDNAYPFEIIGNIYENKKLLEVSD